MTSGDSMIAWSAAFIDSTVEPPTPSMMSPTFMRPTSDSFSLLKDSR